MEDNKGVVDASHLEATPAGKIKGEQLVQLAKDSSDIEHALSPMEAVKAYPMAIFWSLMVNMLQSSISQQLTRAIGCNVCCDGRLRC